MGQRQLNICYLLSHVGLCYWVRLSKRYIGKDDCI
jgi:hypothetical protein